MKTNKKTIKTTVGSNPFNLSDEIYRVSTKVSDTPCFYVPTYTIDYTDPGWHYRDYRKLEKPQDNSAKAATSTRFISSLKKRTTAALRACPSNVAFYDFFMKGASELCKSCPPEKRDDIFECSECWEQQLEKEA